MDEVLRSLWIFVQSRLQRFKKRPIIFAIYLRKYSKFWLVLFSLKTKIIMTSIFELTLLHLIVLCVTNLQIFPYPELETQPKFLLWPRKKVSATTLQHCLYEFESYLQIVEL
jgi:hypothetical protein